MFAIKQLQVLSSRRNSGYLKMKISGLLQAISIGPVQLMTIFLGAYLFLQILSSMDAMAKI